MLYQLTNFNNNMSDQKPEMTEPHQRVVGNFLFPIGVGKSTTNSFKNYIYSGGLVEIVDKINC
jgi:hypothetical protein